MILLLAVAVVALALAAPAGAVVKTVEVAPGEETTVGLQKHSTTLGEVGAEPRSI